MTRHDARDLRRAEELAKMLLHYRGGMSNRAAYSAHFLFNTPRNRRLYLAILRELGESRMRWTT